MSFRHCIAVVINLLIVVVSTAAQNSAAKIQSASDAIPRMIRFSGTAKDEAGKPMAGILGVTFALYKDEQGGAPLWLETQNVQADTSGHYTVMLGATKPNGLPLELFSSADAHWIATQISGHPEQSRILLLSVPYALKAADAATIGGLPPSAFVLAPTAAMAANNADVATTNGNNVLPPALTGTGTTNAVPLWTTASNLGNSNITQVSGIVSVADPLQLPATGTATAAGGKNSQPFDFLASSFSSSSSAAVNQHFRWQAQAVGNDTASPSGSLNLLYSSGAGAPAATGLSIAANGRVTFAVGQTYPGAGTVTSVGLAAPATDFTVSGSPVTGAGTLNVAWKVAPTNTDTASAIVKRDASGNFSAGTVTATAFSGSGAALTNVNAASLGGVAPGGYANLALADTFTQPLTVKAAASTAPLLSVQGTGTGAGGFAIDGYGDLTLAPGTSSRVMNLVAGVGAISQTGSWGNYSALNLISGSALYPIASSQAVFRIGFTGGTTAVIGNMVLYTTPRASLKITAVTPVKYKGVSNPTLSLTSAGTCPNQPISVSNPCIVRLDPVAITLTATNDYYLVLYFTSASSNTSVESTTSAGSISSMAGTYQGGDDTRLTVGKSVPLAVSGTPYFLMSVTSN